MKEHLLKKIRLEDQPLELVFRQSPPRAAYHIAVHFLRYSEADAWEAYSDAEQYWEAVTQADLNYPELQKLDKYEISKISLSESQIHFFLKYEKLYLDAIRNVLHEAAREQRLVAFASKITERRQLWALANMPIVAKFTEDLFASKRFLMLTAFKAGETLAESLVVLKRRISLESDGPPQFLSRDRWTP